VPTNPTQRQATLVALYGAKHDALEMLIERCWEKIAEILGSSFCPYDLNQVHATIVGLERASGPAPCNRNFYNYRQKALSMDLRGFRDSLLSDGTLPFHVQVGGFADRDYPFTSRGLRPHRRSFSIQGDKAVLIGWPTVGKPWPPAEKNQDIRETRLYSDALEEIRLSAQRYNILHAYHRHPGDIDNDFYLRLGVINPNKLGELTRERLENEVRQLLAMADPVLLDVGTSDLYVVSYQEDSLPLGSTKAWSISDSSSTHDFWETLYC
jgi:hypothetical protein